MGLEPEALLRDEPTSALDPERVGDLRPADSGHRGWKLARVGRRHQSRAAPLKLRKRATTRKT